MSWETINNMLGLATVDQQFRRELLEQPLEAAQARGFKLTPREQIILSQLVARDLQEFCQILLDQLAQES